MARIAIEREHFGRNELAVKAVAEGIAANGGDHQPHGVDLFAAVKGDGGHCQGTGYCNGHQTTTLTGLLIAGELRASLSRLRDVRGGVRSIPCAGWAYSRTHLNRLRPQSERNPGTRAGYPFCRMERSPSRGKGGRGMVNPGADIVSSKPGVRLSTSIGFKLGLEKIDFLWRVIRAGFSDTLEGSGQVQVPAVTPVYTGSAGLPSRALRSNSPSHTGASDEDRHVNRRRRLSRAECGNPRQSFAKGRFITRMSSWDSWKAGGGCLRTKRCPSTSKLWAAFCREAEPFCAPREPIPAKHADGLQRCAENLKAAWLRRTDRNRRRRHAFGRTEALPERGEGGGRSQDDRQ